MLNKTDFMNRYPSLKTGMVVYSQDGEKLGKVISMGDESLLIQKGVFFPKDFYARYDDIQDISNDNIYLRHANADLADWQNRDYAGWSHVDEINAGRLNATPKEEYRERYAGFNTEEETRIPVAEERLEANKTIRQAGEVRVQKIVHTELRHFTVPVAHEEVKVERVPVEETDTAAIADQAKFKDETVSVPIMEEEVTISKRPVVREEVRVTKERIEEKKEVEGEVRREEVKIDETGQKKRPAA